MNDELEFLQADKPTKKKNSGITPGTVVLIAGFVLVVIVLGLQLFQQNQGRPEVGKIAPDLSIISYDGDAYTLSDLRGQIVIVNFWASWCPPCHAEARDMQDIWEDYADQGVLMIGLNYLEIKDDALGFIERYDITYPNGPDIAQGAYEAYNVEALPETFVVDEDGRIAAVIPRETDYDELAGILDELLGGGS